MKKRLGRKCATDRLQPLYTLVVVLTLMGFVVSCVEYSLTVVNYESSYEAGSCADQVLQLVKQLLIHAVALHNVSWHVSTTGGFCGVMALVTVTSHI